MPDEHSSFWTTLPGILTGVAALITALVGAAALIIGLRDGTVTPTEPSAGESSPTTGGPTSRGAESTSTIQMRFDDRLDVDTGMAGSDVSDYEVNWVGGWFLHGTRNAVVEGKPDRASCIEALGQRSDDYLPSSQFDDAAACIETEEGVIAAVRPSTPESGRMTVNVTVWA